MSIIVPSNHTRIGAWAVCCCCLSHMNLIRYESSRGHKIDGTNQIKPEIGDKQGKQTEENG